MGYSIIVLYGGCGIAFLLLNWNCFGITRVTYSDQLSGLASDSVEAVLTTVFNIGSDSMQILDANSSLRVYYVIALNISDY